MKCTPSILKRAMQLAMTGAAMSFIAACSDSSSDSSSGYIQIYNAMPSSSTIELIIDDEEYGDYKYNKASSQYLFDGGDYELGFDLAVSSSSTQSLSEFEYNIGGDNVSFFVITGDVSNSEILKFDFEFEDPETDDEQFTFRILNLATDNSELDFYISKGDESFSNASKIASPSLYSLSDSFYYDTNEYKFYITAQNSDDILYESDDISFSYTNQQIITINPNLGAGQSEYRIDTISSSGTVTEYNNKASDAEVRFYNALIEHELLPEYLGNIDIYIDGVDDEAEVSELAQHAHSSFFDIEYGDYPLDITNQNGEALTNTQLVSVEPNASITKFFYLKEEEVEDEDNEDETTTEIYFNSIEGQASTNMSSLYHNIKVLNFSNEYTSIKLYFVASDETKSTTDNVLTSTFSIAKETNLFNESYDVYAVATEGSSEILLASDTFVLNEDSSNYYLLIEENNGTHQLTRISQK